MKWLGAPLPATLVSAARGGTPGRAMAYHFDFASILDYAPVLVKGVAHHDRADRASARCSASRVGIVCALGARVRAEVAATAGVGAYVELIRNTPFIVQLFFIFFGLPALGVKLTEMQGADPRDGGQPGRLQHRDHPRRASRPRRAARSRRRRAWR